MPPSPESLRIHYSGLTDGALQSIAAELDALTPEARGVVLEELQRRVLPLPEQVIAESLELPEPPQWVTVERFRDLSAAIVARGAVEAAEIPCFLRDENTVRLDWQISNFIGGMRLQVMAVDLDAAKQVLEQLALEDSPTDAGPPLPDELCPRCGSTHVRRKPQNLGKAFAMLWLFALPFFRGKVICTCERCHHAWPEGEPATEGA